MPDKLKEVHPDIIIVNQRARSSYKGIDELANSIKEKGLIEPLICEEVEKELHLIAGGRRLQAAKVADVAKIPIIIKSNLSPLQRKELELEENLYREDLSWQDRAKLTREIDQIKKEIHGDKHKDGSHTGWSLRQTAEALSMSPASVSQKIDLAEAMDMFPELSECKTENDARKLLRKMVESMATKELIRKTSEGPSTKHFKYAQSHYMLGDCRTELKKLKPTTVNFVDVDTPYAIDLPELRDKEGKATSSTALHYNEIKRDDYPSFISELSKEVYRVMSWGYVTWWYASEYYDLVYRTLCDAGFSVDRVPCIWHKVGSTGASPRADQFLGRSYEPFLVAWKGDVTLRKQSSTGNVFPFALDKVSDHPAEKPLDLMLAIMNCLAHEPIMGMIPCMGAGTTLRALYKLGYTGFGWDLSQHYKEQFIAQVIKDTNEGLYEVK